MKRKLIGVVVAFLLAFPALAQESSVTSSQNEMGNSEAFIIPLFPQKEEDLKNGFPPGMTLYTFWAARGTAALTMLEDGGVEIVFDFEGLIPFGVYTMWNVLQVEPFKDEPLGGEAGAGVNSVVADRSGQARKVIKLDEWPGEVFLLDYHPEGNPGKPAYPGALWAKWPSKENVTSQ